MDPYTLIREAILKKLNVIATYNGHRREMCPHVLGHKRTKDRRGNLGPREAHALLYQFAGGSSSGLQPDGSADNWRCVKVERLTDVTLREGPWHTAPNHSRPQTCVDEIDVEVRD